MVLESCGAFFSSYLTLRGFKSFTIGILLQLLESLAERDNSFFYIP